MENKQLEENLVKAIQGQAQERLNQLQADYETKRQEIIETYRQEAIEESNVFIEQALAELKNDLIQSGSQSKWKIKKDLFIKRSALVDQLFDEVHTDLINYTQTADYRALMKDALDRALAENPMKEAVVLVKAGEEALFKELLQGKVTVALSDKIHIGGFVLKDIQGQLEVDETLDYALKAQREWFTSHSTLDF